MDTKPFLDAAREAAQSAAAIINHYYRGQLDIERKADSSPVTISRSRSRRWVPTTRRPS